MLRRPEATPGPPSGRYTILTRPVEQCGGGATLTVTAAMRAAAEKAEPPSLVPAGTSSTRQPGGTVGGSDASGHPGAIKVAIVFPDGMHDDGEFASHGDGGPTQTNPRHQCTPPASQRAVGYLARENGICRLEQIGAQKPVAAFRNVPCAIDIPGLVAAGVRPG